MQRWAVARKRKLVDHKNKSPPAGPAGRLPLFVLLRRTRRAPDATRILRVRRYDESTSGTDPRWEATPADDVAGDVIDWLPRPVAAWCRHRGGVSRIGHITGRPAQAKRICDAKNQVKPNEWGWVSEAPSSGTLSRIKGQGARLKRDVLCE